MSRHSGRRQRSGQVRHQAAVRELARRQVHGDGHRRQAERLPGDVLPADRVEHPFSDGHDQAGLFRDRDELHRRDRAQVRMAPAQQGLHAGDAAAPDVPLGLVLEFEFAEFQRVPQAGLEVETLERMRVQLLGIELEIVLAHLLGLVHRDVGVLRERPLVQAVLRIGADPDADRDAELLADQQERAGHRGEDLLSDGHDVLPVVEFRKQDDELVAAQPRHGVAVAQAALEAIGDFLQQLVAGLVAQRVVDLLESIQVQEQHREPPVVAMGLVDGLDEQLAEQAAVGQAGQPVVIGEVLDARGMLDLRVRRTLAAQREASAQMRQQRDDQDQHDATRARPPQVRASVAARGGQLLVRRQPDDHGQRKIVELARIRVAPDPVPRRDGDAVGLAARLALRHERGEVDALARGHDVAAAHRADDPVDAHEPEHALVAKNRRVVAAHEILRVDHDRDHAGELAIGAVEASRELQAPPARCRVAARPCHREGVDLALDPQRLLVDDACGAQLARAGHHGAMAVREAHLEEQIGRQQVSFPQFAEGRPLAPELVGVLDHLERLIDFAKGPHDLRLVSLELLAAGTDGRAVGCGMLDREKPEGCPPDGAQDEDGDQRERQDGRDRPGPSTRRGREPGRGRRRVGPHAHARRASMLGSGRRAAVLLPGSRAWVDPAACWRTRAIGLSIGNFPLTTLCVIPLIALFYRSPFPGGYRRRPVQVMGIALRSTSWTHVQPRAPRLPASSSSGPRCRGCSPEREPSLSFKVRTIQRFHRTAAPWILNNRTEPPMPGLKHPDPGSIALSQVYP